MDIIDESHSVLQTIGMAMTIAKLHKFAVIAVAGGVDPGRPQRGQLQHGILQLSTSR